MIGKRNIDKKTLSKTELETQQKNERDIQDCIIRHIETLLGENIFLFGDEIRIGRRDERIDLLGLDEDLNTVVIELKATTLTRDHLKQALKYAPYVANKKNLSEYYKGDSESFRAKLPQNKLGTYYSKEFEEAYRQFSQADSLNDDQRIMLVGTGVRPETMDLVEWLERRELRIDVIKITPYKDTDSDQVILTADKMSSDDIQSREYQKWEKSQEDAKEWHLKSQTGEKTKKLVEYIISEIESIEFLNDPVWRQRYYISFSDGENIRVKVLPRKTKVTIRLMDISVDRYTEQEIRNQIDEELPITLDADSDRIEFEIVPEKHRTVESVGSFISSEL